VATLAQLSHRELEQVVAALLEARGYIVHFSPHPNHPHWDLISYGPSNVVWGVYIADHKAELRRDGRVSLEETMEWLEGSFTHVLYVFNGNPVADDWESDSEPAQLSTEPKLEFRWTRENLLHLLRQHQDIARRFRIQDVVEHLAEHGPADDENEVVETENNTKYILTRKLGQGAAGTVWEARRPGSIEQNSRCAIKIYHDHVEHAGKESEILASIHHQNIVKCLDFGALTSGKRYLTMELGDDSVADLMGLNSGGKVVPIKEELAILFARDIAFGLAHMHEQNFIHRDVKPHNIIIRGGRAQLGDLGIAKEIIRTLTTHTGKGTPAYLAPEVNNFLKPKVSRASDIWALGITLHQMLNGELPFGDVTAIYALSIRSPREEYNHDIDRIIRLCLVKTPRQRISAADLAVEFTKLMESYEVERADADSKSPERSANAYAATPPPSPSPRKYRTLEPYNLVLRTDFYSANIDFFFANLKKNDRNPIFPRKGEAISEIQHLTLRISEASNIEEGISRIKSSAFFREFFEGQPVTVEKIRNAVPSDVTIVYRGDGESVPLDSKFSVHRPDIISRMVTDSRLLPASQDREKESLHRRVFGLDEMVSADESPYSEELFRTHLSDPETSCHCIVLARDKTFTWALYFWSRIGLGKNAHDTGHIIRAALEFLADPLGRLFETDVRSSLNEPLWAQDTSLVSGLLVFDESFRVLLRQNWAAEAIIEGLWNPRRFPISRQLMLQRIRQEHARQQAPSVASWWVDLSFAPTDSADACIQVQVQIQKAPTGQNEWTVKLIECHLPYLPILNWRELPQAAPSGLGAQLMRLGESLRAHRKNTRSHDHNAFEEGYFVKSLNCVARPVWELDLVADRIRRYPRISLGRVRAAHLFDQCHIYALTRHDRIVGVTQTLY
jgi:serine/threonine protein kinase